MSKALATKNVATVLLGLGVVLAMSLFVSTAKAQTTTTTKTSNSNVSALQTQVQALLAQIAALQGSGTATSGTGACFTFTMNESKGKSGGQVMWIQEFLNGHGFTVAASGAGSPGNETSYFGAATKAAVVKFQNAYAAQVLTPEGLTSGTGNWFAGTRAEANAICAGSTTTTTTTTGGTTTTNGTGITVSAAPQPANSLAPENATRVPFTTFTITNTSGAAVTINGVTVQRTGLANDSAFAGVILIDSNGIQYGNAQTFNSNHQATIGGTFTLQAGKSMTYTVAGNMETTALGNSGQVASISVVGVSTSVPVSGTLPITGAQQTINETLSIGTATVGISGFDPNSQRSDAIGTTGVTFSAIRLTSNVEDQKLFSITWNQTGSAGSTDLSNLVTVVNGVSYPVTVDSSGKYYTSTFPGGILNTKGNSVDAYIKGDITGSNASGRTVEFDIYRSSDIYLVGQTYGYGISPTASITGTYTSSGNNTQSGFRAATANPFYFGSNVSVTGGTLSTVSTAATVAPQNIAVNLSNQVLGGFTTNFTGEPVTVQSIPVNVATSSTNTSQLQNVTLVDQNGNVVAGPVDENLATKTITFNSSVTFPVGAMTYTIKGTVATGALSGGTYTLSTNPNNWTSPVGQTSGTYVTLPVTTITMSTMTVQAGQLNISASASPAASTISQNQSNLTIANIVLDASQSGEDVRLNSLPIVINSSSTSSNVDATLFQSNLTNCQLYNGSTPLNSQSVGSSQWNLKTNLGSGGNLEGVEANFVFTNSLTIPKGTTVTLALECNIGGGLNNSVIFSAGVSANYAPTVTGAQSGNTITPNVTTSTSGTMSVGTASLMVTVPTPLSYAQVAGGTTGVTVGTFTLQPTSGTVSLQNIGLKLNSSFASSSDLANGVVSIYNGSTLVGTANFNGKTPSSGYYYATSTISGLNLPQNVQTVLTLKADIASIGIGNSAMSGHEIRVGLNDANGTSGNSQVDSGAGVQPTTGIAIFKSYPSQIALSSYLPSNGISDGRLIAFTVTANNAGAVGLNQLTFSFASSTGMQIAAPTLYAYTDTGFSQPAGGTTGGIAGSTSYNSNYLTATTTMSTPLEIPAGTTWYFLLKGTVTASGTTYNIATTLKGDTADLAPSMYTVSSIPLNSNMIWSPNSTTTSATANVDWTNGFGINGLPSIGITNNRTQ